MLNFNNKISNHSFNQRSNTRPLFKVSDIIVGYEFNTTDKNFLESTPLRTVLNNINTRLEEVILTSGSNNGMVQYSAGNGCYVSATGLGITFTRTSATEWSITIPEDVDIISGQIYSTSAQNPGTNVYITFNFVGVRTFNNDTTGVDAKPPKHIWGINMAGNGNGSTPITRVNPQPYAATTGATNLLPRLTAVANGDIEIEIQNYTSALGASASLVLFAF